MQSFIVLASLVFELAGGQNDPLSPLRYKKHLRVNKGEINEVRTEWTLIKE